jgi:hypothetical protein
MDSKTVYIKVHAPWEVLAQGAEEMTMGMPTIVSATLNRLDCTSCTSNIQCALVYCIVLYMSNGVPLH